MTLKQRQADTERAPSRVVYYRSDCADHPNPERPDQHRPQEQIHHRLRGVVCNGDPDDVVSFHEGLTPERCGCGGAIKARHAVFEWPPVPVSGEAALDMFRRSDGYVALEIEALNYPEDPLDWQAILGIEDFRRDSTWFAGLVGDQLVTRTKFGHEPIWSATAVKPDEIGVLLRRLPSEPKAVWRTGLNAALKDYQAGHEVQGCLVARGGGRDAE